MKQWTSILWPHLISNALPDWLYPGRATQPGHHPSSSPEADPMLLSGWESWMVGEHWEWDETQDQDELICWANLNILKTKQAQFYFFSYLKLPTSNWPWKMVSSKCLVYNSFCHFFLFTLMAKSEEIILFCFLEGFTHQWDHRYIYMW